ncbi:MAG TPA: NAD(P)/FAD-dependent oxidoreductase [Saprospiraceae bacterium]|nr:NAD(P)/FAD-dependent oxidoreductase [Saprospiraceae bacterium]
MPFNIPESDKPRLVIIGAGFGGLTLARKLQGKGFQIVLLDKNNYHQFQPLFYQVAMSGLEPSSICFPLRKNFQAPRDLFVRVAEVSRIFHEQKTIESSIGILRYDMLVLAMGAVTNFYGNPEFERFGIPLKSVSEALYLRNSILDDLEKAVMTLDPFQREAYLNIVIVGGGPTGVELAGALAEMKKYILPKDYPDLDASAMQIHLVQATPRLLDGMSEKASLAALKDLKKMGVEVHLQAKVAEMNEHRVRFADGTELKAHKIIWAAGVKALRLEGLPDSVYAPGGRILVNGFGEVESLKDVYCMGDQALMKTAEYPNGLPGLAPVALQQAAFLARHLRRKQQGRSLKSFKFTDKGAMATIGRHKAVLDFHSLFLSGFPAWLGWLFVHIYYLIGVRNKLIVMINWMWNYLFYDQALRLNIKPKWKEHGPGKGVHQDPS